MPYLVMGYATGVNVIQSNLLVHLESGNTSSYPGSGTTLTDLSGNSNNGTLVNGPTFTGDSFNFDNTLSQYVSIADVPGDLDMENGGTIMMWAKQDWNADTTQRHLASKTQSGGWQIRMNNPNGSLNAYGHIGGAYRGINYSATNLTDGEWYCIGLTFDGQYLRLYVDGINVGTYDHGSSSTITPSGVMVALGAEPESGGSVHPTIFWDDEIADFLMYSVALSPAEMYSNFVATKDKFKTTAVYIDDLFLRLDPTNASSYPGSGTTITDISPNGPSNTGTIVNSPTYDGSKSFALNGTTQYVSIADADALSIENGGSIMIWGKNNDWSSTANQKLMSKTQIGDWQININSGTPDGFLQIMFYIDGDYRRLNYATTNLSNSDWYHIAGTFDGRYIYMYVDGVLVDSYDHGSVSAITPTTAGLLIGAEPDAAGLPDCCYWNGDFGQALMYSSALTEFEVGQNFIATKAIYGK